MRAWSIIEYCKLPYMIKEYKGSKVGLSRWFLPINNKFISNKADKLEVEFYIDVQELNNCKVLFEW